MLSHPNAALGMFGVLFLALWLERGRIRPRQVVLAAISHLIFAAGWGLYILQSSQDFTVQFRAAVEGRGEGVAKMWLGLRQ